MPMRGKRFCPLSGRCGGCDYAREEYREELGDKEVRLMRLLGRYGRVGRIVPSEPSAHYRAKVQAVCAMDGRSLVTGIYRKGTHRVIPVRSCLLEDERAGEILATIRRLSSRYGIEAYDEDRDTGDLRHVLIRIGVRTGEALVALVVPSFGLPHASDLAAAVHQRHSYVKTVVMVENREKTSMVIPEGAQERVIYGKGWITERINGLEFRISASSFFQVNPYQAERLYDYAMDVARLRPTDTVIDAYCGTGTIALIAASRGAGRVIGVESNPAAVRDARENAEHNRIENAEFVNADASKWMKQQAKEGLRCDVLFLDPPRSGATEEFLAAASRMEPEVIVYISCNPDTLERDLRYISRFLPYRVRQIQPFDMFPQSVHVETVALLTRQQRRGE